MLADFEEEDVVEERQVDGVTVSGRHLLDLPFCWIWLRSAW
jgi:hypothetical protein